MRRPPVTLLLLAAMAVYGTGVARYAHNIAAHGEPAGICGTHGHCESNDQSSSGRDASPAPRSHADCGTCFMLATNFGIVILPMFPPAVEPSGETAPELAQRIAGLNRLNALGARGPPTARC